MARLTAEVQEARAALEVCAHAEPCMLLIHNILSLSTILAGESNSYYFSGADGCSAAEAAGRF